MIIHHRNTAPLDVVCITDNIRPTLASAFVTDVFGGQNPTWIVQNLIDNSTTTFSSTEKALDALVQFHNRHQPGSISLFDQCRDKTLCDEIASKIARVSGGSIEIHEGLLGDPIDPNEPLLVSTHCYPGTLPSLYSDIQYNFGGSLQVLTRWDKCTIILDPSDYLSDVFLTVSKKLEHCKKNNISVILEYELPEVGGFIQICADQLKFRLLNLRIQPGAGMMN